MSDQFIVDGRFVGLTKDGKVSLPKGCAPDSAVAKVWLGRLLSLIWLHNRCTKNGEKAGREGVAGAKTAPTAGDASDNKGTSPIEAEDDALPSHLAQFRVLIDALLERAIDPVVFAVQRRIIRSEEILYSQLHRHMHHAVFADDDVIMLESMLRAGFRGRFEASDMIGLLCWLAQDIEENIALSIALPENVRGLAEDFSDRHLHHNATLFGEARQDMLDDLRTTFEEVRRYHPPVDADTEGLIEVIENYLYAGKELENRGAAQQDVLFGSEFYDVWEMLCLHHAYENDINEGWQVLIADGGNLPNWLRTKDAFKNTLVDAVIGDPEKSDYQAGLESAFNPLRPDLILYKEDENTLSYRVIDFKYYKWDDLRAKLDLDNLNNSEKKFFLGVVEDGILNRSKSDIAKSWCYARSVTYWHNVNKPSKKLSITLEFWLPSDGSSLKRDYPAGELHAKPISSMIDELLKESPNPWLERKRPAVPPSQTIQFMQQV